MIINRIKPKKIPLFGQYTFEFIFLIKVLLGGFIYWLYTFYYPIRIDADIYKYFDDGRVLFELAQNDFSAYLNALFNSELPDYIKPAFRNWHRSDSFNFVNSNLSMIKIHSVLFFISGGIYHIHSLLFCFGSFLGFLFLYKALLRSFENLNSRTLLLAFIIPSFILWNSAPLKEALIGFSLFFQVGCVVHLKYKFQVKHLILLILFSVLTFYSKPYFLIGILPLIIIYIIPSKKRTYIKYRNATILAIFFITIFEVLLDQNGLTHFIYQKQISFLDLLDIKSANSFNTHLINETLLELIVNIPNALFNVFLKPFIWESTNPLFLFSAIENIFIIAAIGLSLIFRKKNLSYQSKNLILFLSIYVLIEFALIGLTTPVIGAIVRYKSPLLPFILISCILLIDIEKLKKYVAKKRS